MKTISELDFARILLRNTVLTQDEYKGYLSRLQQRIPEPKVKFQISAYLQFPFNLNCARDE